MPGTPPMSEPPLRRGVSGRDEASRARPPRPASPSFAGMAAGRTRRASRHRLRSGVTYVRTPQGREVDFLVRSAAGEPELVQVCADSTAAGVAERELRAARGGRRGPPRGREAPADPHPRRGSPRGTGRRRRPTRLRVAPRRRGLSSASRSTLKTGPLPGARRVGLAPGRGLWHHSPTLKRSMAGPGEPDGWGNRRALWQTPRRATSKG